MAPCQNTVSAVLYFFRVCAGVCAVCIYIYFFFSGLVCARVCAGFFALIGIHIICMWFHRLESNQILEFINILFEFTRISYDSDRVAYACDRHSHGFHKISYDFNKIPIITLGSHMIFIGFYMILTDFFMMSIRCHSTSQVFIRFS